MGFMSIYVHVVRPLLCHGEAPVLPLPSKAVRLNEGTAKAGWAVAAVEGADSRGGLVSVMSGFSTILSQAFLWIKVVMNDKAHRDQAQYKFKKLLLALDFFHSVWIAPSLLLAARIQSS